MDSVFLLFNKKAFKIVSKINFKMTKTHFVVKKLNEDAALSPHIVALSPSYSFIPFLRPNHAKPSRIAYKRQVW